MRISSSASSRHGELGPPDNGWRYSEQALSETHEVSSDEPHGLRSDAAESAVTEHDLHVADSGGSHPLAGPLDDAHVDVDRRNVSSRPCQMREERGVIASASIDLQHMVA